MTEVLHTSFSPTDSSRRHVIVGLTGGLAAGKSLVARMFSCLGALVWDADTAAKRLYQTDSRLQQSILQRWGEEIAITDKGGNMIDVDRMALSNIIFKSAQELAWLRSQVHPRVSKKFQEWLINQNHAPRLIIRETAILFESKSDATCDITITVEAHESLRIERAQSRANIQGTPVPSQSEIQARIDKQWNEAQRMAHADHVILNNRNVALLPQVLKLWDALT